jgi:tRNA(Arg) A34 adenosine deaminase TadA
MAKKRYLIKATCYDKRGRKLSQGVNSYTKTHPIQAYFAQRVGEPMKKYLHAEIAAIIKAGDTPIHTIEISHKPCKICQEAIKAYGIKRVVYAVRI